MTSIIRPRIALATALLLSAFTTTASFADTVGLKANLQPSSEVPPRVSKGHGVLDAPIRHIDQDADLDRDVR